MVDMTLPRCFGDKPGQEAYALYHDTVWGKPVHDDRQLFEDLILEGAQAGLSYWTVLQKKAGYQEAFHNFDVDACMAMSDAYLEAQLENPGIVRNRLKVFSVRKNAHAFRQIQEEYGSFDAYLWAYVDGTPIKRRPKNMDELTVSDPLSIALSKDLKKRGMTFVGPTIMYAYMQAVGLIDEHMAHCHCA